MAITEQQRALRAGRVGSSDAGRVMAGDWLALWREKTGRAEPANLDLVAAVQIGIATEHLHPRFVEHATGVPCVPAEGTAVHPEHDWLVAHPDFLSWDGAPAGAPDTLVEAKFSGGFQSDADLAQRYHWQLQHQFLATGMQRGMLSILRPTGHSLMRVRRSEVECDRLLATLEAFWWHVANDVEPSDPLPADAPLYETLRVVDMARHNRFAALAATLVERRPAALECRDAEAALKALMPADARVAFVAGLYLARDRDGRLSLRYGEPPRRALDRAERWDSTTVLSADLSLSAVLDGGWGEGRDQQP
ncbi:YqaJ viral recombinase family protein [Azospirillum sp. sgz301742]